jgi:hypothetical protein
MNYVASTTDFSLTNSIDLFWNVGYLWWLYVLNAHDFPALFRTETQAFFTIQTHNTLSIDQVALFAALCAQSWPEGL